MRVSVSLPPALLAIFPDAESSLQVDASDLREVMVALEQRWPGMRACLCDTTPSIRSNLAVFVNGRRAALDTRLEDGAEVFVLTRISGG